jgi:predicted TIM-barrel fold metal-dependent hydrolase
MHLGRLYVQDPGLSPEFLLEFMDRSGIERAALHPIESPEEAHFYVTTETVLDICRRHPTRFIPFCNVDPRIGSGDNTATLRARLQEYKAAGCKGYGEAMSGLRIDDERLQRVYRLCGELGIPIIYHIDADRNVDEKGFPGLERMLARFPDTILVGHGQHFWAEISGDVTPAQFSIYPKGPITPGGSILRLLERYPNLYADLSAGSALNAMTREPEFGYRFLERFQDRLFFATDICVRNPNVPNVAWFKALGAEGRISTAAYRKIARDNAIRVFGLEPAVPTDGARRPRRVQAEEVIL